MTILLNNITVPIEAGSEAAVHKALAQLSLPVGSISTTSLAKVSVDSRRGMPKFVCSVAITLTEQGEAALKEVDSSSYTLRQESSLTVQKGTEPLRHRPVVVGFGPAGLFAAWLLAREGYRPLVLERGGSIQERKKAVQAFWKGEGLSTQSNVQFGEGGAGAFSDGKLTTRINDPLCGLILSTLVAFGAPTQILMMAKPHVGTDLLTQVVKTMREEIIRLGGEVRFLSHVTAFEVHTGALKSVQVNGEQIPAQAAIVAIGHSARDTLQSLHQAGAALTAKAFSVGARIEHLQAELDKALYGNYAGHPNLPPAEYQLSHREGDRAVYTFCMCPGGMVVAASTQSGQVVTNGMSYQARNLKNANSALAVSVSPADFGEGWQDGIALQQKLEAAAFAAGGGDYTAPFCRVGALTGRQTTGAVPEPSYPLGVREYPIKDLFPPKVGELLERSLPIFGRKLTGFNNPGAALTGVETRTSSPVRILREQNGFSKEIDGLLPCGEGAGYAGGIMSAGVDGLKSALALMERYAPAVGE